MKSLELGTPPQSVADLVEYLRESPSPAHAVGASARRLEAAGFTRLDPRSRWILSPGGGYFVEIDGRSLVAFRLPEEKISAFHIVGAHTDSPALRLKERSAYWSAGLLVTPTEPYGGPIYSTWLDRPLSLAGMAALRKGKAGEAVIERVLVPNLELVIPNLAIHFNREVNKGIELNPQTQLKAISLPAVPEKERERPWEYIVSQALNEKYGNSLGREDILAMDLYLGDAEAPRFLDPSFLLLNAPRIDNLEGSHAALQAIIGSPVSRKRLQMIALFDHEEIGSRSNHGADSTMLLGLMRRIWDLSASGDSEDWNVALADSLHISVDVAHAVHPSHVEKHDPAYAPVLNGGPVLKSNVNHKYASQIQGSAYFAELCRSRGVPMQSFIIRADLAGGSTIGPIVSSATGIPAIDVGIPILAMHSIRETAGTEDHRSMISVLGPFLDAL